MPIYLECLSDAVIIQPYGIRLEEADFELRGNADNPLASGLRAAVAYVARQQGFGELGEPPYPLLVVRPKAFAPITPPARP